MTQLCQSSFPHSSITFIMGESQTVPQKEMVGFSCAELESLQQRFKRHGVVAELLRLTLQLQVKEQDASVPAPEEACVLILRQGIPKLLGVDPDLLHSEMFSCQWDQKKLCRRRKKVLNQHARWRVSFDDAGRSPNYETGKGTVWPYSRAVLMQKCRDQIRALLGVKTYPLTINANIYPDVNRCGIGYHGDAERKIVIAGCLGKSKPIQWQWFLRSQAVGQPIRTTTHHGDLYVMSEKATGFDWLSRSKYTLRHAACDKYIRLRPKSKNNMKKKKNKNKAQPRQGKRSRSTSFGVSITTKSGKPRVQHKGMIQTTITNNFRPSSSHQRKLNLQ